MELNTSQLIQIITNDKKSSKDFIGVFPRDRLPRIHNFPCSFIINTHKSDMKGEHWLAFYFDHDKKLDFFDSYGNSPSFFKLDQYINHNSSSTNYNTIQLQSFHSRLCGFYCVLFILYRSRGFTMNQFLDKFTDFTSINDFILLNLIKT
jgi:hypothetical protein